MAARILSPRMHNKAGPIMVKKALAFGLEYKGQGRTELAGCALDAAEFGAFLRNELGYDKVRICTSDAETGAQYMIHKIYKLAIDTWRRGGGQVDEVCIYYSGHGSHMADRDGDERGLDGRDECLVPTDYARAGVITDDLLKRVFRYFHPDTRVVFVCDACHSGSMCDLKYKYVADRGESVNAHPQSKCAARIVSMSGCKDDEVSYVGFNLRGERKRRSVLTVFLLEALADNRAGKIKEVHADLSRRVRASGYPQTPELMTSFPVFDSDTIFT